MSLPLRLCASTMVATALALSLSACGEASLDAFGSERAPIVAGSPDPDHPEVLLFYNDPQLGPCTATLVAPSLVLTARHCVSLETGALQFCGNASDPGVGFDLPVYGADRDPADLSVSAVPGGPPLAQGVQIFHDGASTTCRHDLALVHIDPPITDIEPAAIRAEPAVVGEALTAAGWGYIDDAQTQTTNVLRSKQVEVLAIGPLTYAFHPYDDTGNALQDQAVVDDELLVSFGTTAGGDSGGPAFDGDGAIVGTIARGYFTPSYGPSTLSAVHGHLEVIDEAFAAVGYTGAGGAGGSGGDATGGAARGGAPGTGGTGGGQPGGGGEAATGVGAGANPPVAPSSADDGGCSAAGGRDAGGGMVTAVCLAFGLFAARRRRRASPR